MHLYVSDSGKNCQISERSVDNPCFLRCAPDHIAQAGQTIRGVIELVHAGHRERVQVAHGSPDILHHDLVFPDGIHRFLPRDAQNGNDACHKRNTETQHKDHYRLPQREVQQGKAKFKQVPQQGTTYDSRDHS